LVAKDTCHASGDFGVVFVPTRKRHPTAFGHFDGKDPRVASDPPGLLTTIREAAKETNERHT